MECTTTTDISAVTDGLAGEPFPHLMTLKTLTVYPDGCSAVLYRNGSRWACRTELGTAHSAWNLAKYPRAESIIMLDGNEPELLHLAISEASSPRVVFKVHDEWSRGHFGGSPDYELAATYVSYTWPHHDAFAGNVAESSGVEHHWEFSDQSMALFAKNGYTAKEVRSHISRGASWFGHSVSGNYVSACIVFPNYRSIWEIGGVYTERGYRRQGYARVVVGAALQYLRSHRLTPRYQFLATDEPSRALARSLGLTGALTVDHYISVSIA